MTAGTTVRLSLAELRDAAGTELGRTDWIPVEQGRIDAFADTIDDHQWIHVDPDRARTTVHGGTIAHGYLTLSASGARLVDLLEVEDAASILNYGVDRARFITPVRSGARIRVAGTISGVDDVPGGLQVAVRLVTEIEGAARPACVADILVRYLR